MLHIGTSLSKTLHCKSGDICRHIFVFGNKQQTLKCPFLCLMHQRRKCRSSLSYTRGLPEPKPTRVQYILKHPT